MERNPDHRAFWALADDLIAEGKVEEGTMMGHHCLRSTQGGGFVATVCTMAAPFANGTHS